MYESSPPTLRTTDHEARITPGIHPKNSRVLTLTAGVEEEEEEEDDIREELVRPVLLLLPDGGNATPALRGEYTVGNIRRNIS